MSSERAYMKNPYRPGCPTCSEELPSYAPGVDEPQICDLCDQPMWTRIIPTPVTAETKSIKYCQEHWTKSPEFAQQQKDWKEMLSQLGVDEKTFLELSPKEQLDLLIKEQLDLLTEEGTK